MIRGIGKNAVYYALIIVFIAASLFLLAPSLFPSASGPVGGGIIISPNNFSTVNLTILTSSKCKTLCNTRSVETSLTNLLVNVNINRVDVETPRGKQLAEQNNISLVPAYFFDSSLEQSRTFPTFSQYVRRTDNGFVLNTLEVTSGYLFGNNASASPEMVLFVASFDPNSLQMQNTTVSLLNSRFNNSINLSLRYAVGIVNFSLASVHGVSELIEDSIQLCALETKLPRVLDAVTCRAREILDCYNSSAISVDFCAQIWRSCMGAWDVPIAQVETCLATQNKTLLKREADATIDYNIGAVPTLIIGNQYRQVGKLTQGELFGTLCAVYPRLAGCTVRIS